MIKSEEKPGFKRKRRHKKENTGLLEEYFPDCPPEGLTETTSRIFIDVPAKERCRKERWAANGTLQMVS